MLPPADISGLRPASLVEAPSPVEASADARQELYQRFAQIAVGSKLQADVLSLINDGTFLVQVADTNVRMSLPADTRVGDSLSLTLLGTDPRPTFLLDTEAESTTTNLSSAAQLITDILQNAEDQNAPAVLKGKAPLAPSPAALLSDSYGQQLATTLHDMLSTSGLFYESHIQEWMTGQRTIADLMEEPQAQASKLLSFKAETLVQAVQNEAQPRASEHTSLATPANTQLSQHVQSLPLNADTIIHNRGDNIMSTESMQMINLQLHTLEHNQVVWRGELFPGQQLEWEINEDNSRGSAGQEQSAWQSSVRFKLPTLGTVSATIHLLGDRVHIQINTQTEGVANTLQAYGSKLSDALAAAGSPLDSLLIKKDGNA
jgi:hypothetical protein